MEHIQGHDNICLSGGADGADMEWCHSAAALGHKVIHWSFPGHKTQASEDDIIRLSDEQLQLGREAVVNAAQALGKTPPQKKTVWRLLHRNYYQVAWSTSCYAVTAIRDDVLPGGTAWATTMFSQLHPESRNLWLFDQDKDQWLQWAGDRWEVINSPPRPSGLWAGIGARNLKQNGRDAIRKLMGCEAGDA